MKKGILLCLLWCMVMTGCGRDENALEIEQEPRQATEEQNTKEILDTEKSKAVAETSDEEEIVKYPLVAVPSAEFIDIVLVSEERYCIYDGEKYGYMTEDGEEITPYIYDIAYPFHEGLACVSCEGKFGYIDLSGNTVLPFVYDRATPFMEGLAYFSIGDEYGFMDKSGTPVFYLDCDSVSSFQEGLAYFSVDGRYGYIDQLGQIVIEPVYDDAGYFKDGFAEIVRNGRHGIIDRNGTEIIAPAYDEISMNVLFFYARSEDGYDCFNNTGKKLLESCEYIWVENGYLRFEKKGKWGIADADGKILLEPVYDNVQLVGEKKLVVVKEGEVYGILDFLGEAKVPFLYSEILYDGSEEDGLFYILQDGKWGCLDGTDFSERIPCMYDSIGRFIDNHAVVTLDGQYGVINKYGVLELPIVYDSIVIWENGDILQKRDSIYTMYDCNGKLLMEGEYDAIRKYGDCFEIEIDGKYGFVNKQGEEVAPVIYDFVSEFDIYGSFDVHLLTKYNSDIKYCILKTGDSGKVDISKALLKNEITPRQSVYLDFVQKGSINESDSQGEVVVEMKELAGYRKNYKLFDVNHSGNPVLYFYAEPYVKEGFPESYSGFYGICNNQLVELVTGCECGGSLQGDYVCLWYDKEEDDVLLGRSGTWGGFGGTANERQVYVYDKGALSTEISFGMIYQFAGNYSEEELLAHAELFYNEKDEPYTKETILDAEEVMKYSVNEMQTKAEDYYKAAERYQRLAFLE